MVLCLCLSVGCGYNGCLLAQWQCFNKWQGVSCCMADRLEFANIYLAIHWCTLMMADCGDGGGVARWSSQCYANGNISRWWPGHCHRFANISLSSLVAGCSSVWCYFTQFVVAFILPCIVPSLVLKNLSLQDCNLIWEVFHGKVTRVCHVYIWQLVSDGGGCCVWCVVCGAVDLWYSTHQSHTYTCLPS